MVGAIAIAFAVITSGAKIAYKVNYEGKYIATVANKSEFTKAVDVVKAKVSGEDVEKAVSIPKYETSLVLEGEIDTILQITKAIIENTDEIVEATEISVNGNVVATVSGNEVQDFLNARLKSHDIEGVSCTSQYVDDIKFNKGFFLKNDLDNIEFSKKNLEKLSVKTTATVITDSEIPYKTETQNSKSHIKGYVATKVKGENGVRRLTETVEFVDGVEISRAQVGDEVIKEPINKVVVKGTASTQVSAELQQLIEKSNFVFPLPKGTYRVSAWYGDGRNHKGLDLASPKGTQIMAVKSGKVTYAGWKGGYGNFVEIDHGDGLVTRYAHASALCCKTGDTVKAGDVIALVGTTGDSTGNHLHIEVRYKGVAQNPAPYLGLK